MYCDIELVKKSMPNECFGDGPTSLMSEADLRKWCDRIASQMDTKFLASNLNVPLTEDQVIAITGDEEGGAKVYDTIILANIYGTRELVYTTLATSDEEASEMAKQNKDLFEEAMNDIMRVFGGRNTIASGYSSAARAREPIIRLRDQQLW